MNHYREKIPLRSNAIFFGFILMINVFQFIILPAFLLPINPWFGLFILPLAFSNTLHWSLIHEAIHKLIHPDHVKNDLMGRALSIVFGGALEVLRFGHLMHHRFNRHIHTEFCPANVWQWLKAAPTYYAQLFFGMYVIEIAASFAFAFLPKAWLERIYKKHATDAKGRPLPELREATETFFFKNSRIQRIRIDAVFIILFFGLSFYLYASYWLIGLAALMLRAFMISFHDNVYHYGTAEDNSVPAKELKLVAPISRYILHFNYHHSHHKAPFVPWKHLPEIHREKQVRFDDDYGRALKLQLNGPIMKNEE